MFDKLGIIHLSPKAAFAQTNSVFGFQSTHFHTTGTIGIDHNAFVANDLSDEIIFDSHIFVVSIAAHTINQVIATHNTETISFINGKLNQPMFNFISHHKISLPPVAISSLLNHIIIVTNTDDILIAKQIIAGEKIIGIRFFNLRYSNNFHLNTFFQISSNASAKTINGAKTIANQITQILIIKITTL